MATEWDSAPVLGAAVGAVVAGFAALWKALRGDTKERVNALEGIIKGLTERIQSLEAEVSELRRQQSQDWMLQANIRSVVAESTCENCKRVALLLNTHASETGVFRAIR